MAARTMESSTSIRRKITLNDIAAGCGVSRATVSLVLRGSPLVAAQLHGQPQPGRGHEIERLPPSQRANGGGDHQPDRVAADDVCRFMREERAELVVRKLAQRADRHADFARERDRHAQRAAARYRHAIGGGTEYLPEERGCGAPPDDSSSPEVGCAQAPRASLTQRQ